MKIFTFKYLSQKKRTKIQLEEIAKNLLFYFRKLLCANDLLFNRELAFPKNKKITRTMNIIQNSCNHFSLRFNESK